MAARAALISNIRPMTENVVAASPSRPPRRWWRALWFVIVVAILAALGYGGRELLREHADAQDILASQDVLLRRMGRQLTLQQSQLDDLEGRFADIAQTAHNNSDEVAAAHGRLDDVEQALAKLRAEVQGGHMRVQLLAIEQLLLLANERLQLAGDARTALAALNLAQERLGTLADPGLFDVRKAIAAEHAALAAVAQPDLGGAALALGSLIERAPKLPLSLNVPERFNPPPAPVAAAPTTADWHARVAARVHALLASLFTVHYTDRHIEHVLNADQAALVSAVLSLKLEVARSELLRKDTPAFRDSLRAASDWLAQYYRKDDPGVLAMQAELERLQTLELSPPLPDLSRGVGLLRAYLDARPK
jgi:uroporphyrin-3 C-methyltransferase